jgi:hypothetical protein
VPDLSHLWQRFVLATALLFGLALGVALTVFGYSNTAPVSVGWSVFHLNGIPLWTVVVVPLVVVLVAGTVYHWFNSLHHFTEHMRHRRRVHELEAEVTSLRAHLDQLLEMPDHTTTPLQGKPMTAEVKPIEPDVPAPALLEPAVANGADQGDKTKKSRKRVSLAAADTQPVAVAATADVTTTSTDAVAETEPREESPAEP